MFCGYAELSDLKFWITALEKCWKFFGGIPGLKDSGLENSFVMESVYTDVRN